jgi:hypothetical protein
MPATLALAAVTPTATVFPQSLSTSESLTAVFPLLSNYYHDGTLHRSLITDGVNVARPARIWRLSKRLTTAQLTTLLTFWETAVLGGLNPFYLYDPYARTPGTPVGSNYDATGVSTTGRVTVYFRGNWQHSTDLGRHTVPSLELVEVA